MFGRGGGGGRRRGGGDGVSGKRRLVKTDEGEDEESQGPDGDERDVQDEASSRQGQVGARAVVGARARLDGEGGGWAAGHDGAGGRVHGGARGTGGGGRGRRTEVKGEGVVIDPKQGVIEQDGRRRWRGIWTEEAP